MEILQTFGVNVSLLFASIVNFAILAVILNKILYQPLLKTLDQRKKTIEESLHNAEQIEQKLHHTEEQERRVILKARITAQTIIDKAEQQATLRQQEIVQHAKTEAKQIIQQTESMMTEKVKVQEKELKQHFAELVALTTRKILENHAPTSLTTQYIEEIVPRITKVKQYD